MNKEVEHLVKTTFGAFKKDCVSIPDTYELSGDPARLLGDQAEQTVYNSLKNCKIPGLKLVFFHGTR